MAACFGTISAPFDPSQRGEGDLIYAGRTERKDRIVELLGFGYLERLAEACRNRIRSKAKTGEARMERPSPAAARMCNRVFMRPAPVCRAAEPPRAAAVISRIAIETRDGGAMFQDG